MLLVAVECVVTSHTQSGCHKHCSLLDQLSTLARKLLSAQAFAHLYAQQVVTARMPWQVTGQGRNDKRMESWWFSVTSARC